MPVSLKNILPKFFSESTDALRNKSNPMSQLLSSLGIQPQYFSLTFCDAFNYFKNFVEFFQLELLLLHQPHSLPPIKQNFYSLSLSHSHSLALLFSCSLALSANPTLGDSKGHHLVELKYHAKCHNKQKWNKILAQCQSYLVGKNWQEWTNDNTDVRCLPLVTNEKMASILNSLTKAHKVVSRRKFCP